jgi:hypothetical protein
LSAWRGQAELRRASRMQILFPRPFARSVTRKYATGTNAKRILSKQKTRGTNGLVALVFGDLRTLGCTDRRGVSVECRKASRVRPAGIRRYSTCSSFAKSKSSREIVGFFCFSEAHFWEFYRMWMDLKLLRLPKYIHFMLILSVKVTL